MVQIIKGWACPYCDKAYEKESEAEDCAEDCAPQTEDPGRTTIIKCEMCGQRFDDEQDAADCEKAHEKWKDRLYEEWKVKKNFEKLAEAAAHPAQVTLDKGRQDI